MKKVLPWVIAALVVLGGAYFMFQGQVTLVVTDTTYAAGDKIPARLVVENGAKLTFEGDLRDVKSIACKDGPLSITVNGDFVMEKGTLGCAGDPAESDADAVADRTISIVVKGDLLIGEGATVTADGTVQIVDDESKLLTSAEALEAAYQEAAKPTGDGPRFGPFVEGGSVSKEALEPAAVLPKTDTTVRFMNVAFAEESPTATDKDGNEVPGVVIGGDWIIGEGDLPPTGLQVPTPGKKVKRILLNFDFGPGKDVHLVQFHLVGPDGEDGDESIGTSCTATGGDGKDAMRFRVKAGKVNIDDFRIELGRGGFGGSAETTKDCEHGVAKGGKGGEAGNMKITAENGITIRSMTIVPGAGGNGGGATAFGKDGKNSCPGEKGGDATATGGAGGANKKELSADGAVSGIENVTVAEVTGGFGGSAEAHPGKGGDGTGCNCSGGAGGKASATGGKGGDASVKVAGAAVSNGATGGDGGDAEAIAGLGGAGGQCPLKPKGGNGGKGGDASSKAGKGGAGTTAPGSDGNVEAEKGGDGGNGGDGCGPGGGGAGGKGREPGADGKPGILKCPAEEVKKDTTVTPPTGGTKTTPTDTTGGTSSGGGASGSGGGSAVEVNVGGSSGKPIQVIEYQGKYLPVDQLIVEDEVGCGADHWHARDGVVVATDGTKVFDPGPQCGYGKTSDVPAMQYFLITN